MKKRVLLLVPAFLVMILTGCKGSEGAPGGKASTDSKSAEARWGGISEKEREKICKATLAMDSEGMLSALVAAGFEDGAEIKLMTPHAIDKCVKAG